MEPVTGWQAFIGHLADQARRDQRDRKCEAIGRVLYAVIFAALLTALVGGAMQSLGWLP
jgi:hypothetical protein